MQVEAGVAGILLKLDDNDKYALCIANGIPRTTQGAPCTLTHTRDKREFELYIFLLFFSSLSASSHFAPTRFVPFSAIVLSFKSSALTQLKASPYSHSLGIRCIQFGVISFVSSFVHPSSANALLTECYAEFLIE